MRAIQFKTNYLWLILRWKNEPEIILRTYYPGCLIRLRKSIEQWEIEVTNRDEYKISSREIIMAFNQFLVENLPGDCRLKRSLEINFRLDSISLENWRDIFHGRIDELINDENASYISNKIGTFGYLKKRTKPVRLKFISYADQYPNYFEYIATEKYSSTMQGYISLLEYKRKFKYIIDLPGHTYSTKSYWMLFLKRPLFYVEPNLKFQWERKLIPWFHYIPVKRDLTDLVRHYEWAETNPEKVEKLSKNLYEFGLREMPPSKVTEQLVENFKKCIV